MGFSAYIIITISLLAIDRSMGQNPKPPIRLAGGGNDTQGRVEMFYNDQWGTICSDGWDDADANVICRMLGFNGISKAVLGSSTDPSIFGFGEGPIHMRSTECDGNEQSILDCRSQLNNVTQCNHNEDAGVMCYNLSLVFTTPRFRFPPWIEGVETTVPLKTCTTPNENIELRLADNSTSQSGSGRVMYRKDGEWRGVCFDNWGQNEADVVCRMLCYNPFYSEAISVQGAFGESAEGFWLSGVRCQGTEGDLSECEHDPWGYDSTCGVQDVAAVNCQRNVIDTPEKLLPWVDCEIHNVIRVVISLRSKPLLLPSYIQVVDSTGLPISNLTCRFNSSKDENFVYTDLPLVGCGTIKTINSTAIIYTNYISYFIPYADAKIVRSDAIVIKASCVMDRNNEETETYDIVPWDNVDELGKGKYYVRLLRYKDRSYTTVVATDQSFPVRMSEWIYASVQLFTEDRSLKLILDNVFVSESMPPITNQSTYYLIRDRCAIDDKTELTLYNNTVVRFRFQSLKFANNISADTLYMNSNTHVCAQYENNGSCTRGCTNLIRSKRSAFKGAFEIRNKNDLKIVSGGHPMTSSSPSLITLFLSAIVIANV